MTRNASRAKKHLRASVFVLCATAANLHAATPAAVGYVNAHVFTGSGWANGVAISGDKVLAVGDEVAIRSALPAHAPLINLHGRTVMPGLFDLHIHPIAGARALHSCNFGAEAGIEDIVAAVSKCTKQASPGAWVYGGGWKNDSPIVKQFDKALLDKVSPNNPVLLMDTTGHNGWANSKALAAGGYTRASIDPPDGKIVRNARGEPTGLVYESPAAKLRYSMPTSNTKEASDLLASAFDVFAANGITAVSHVSLMLDEAKGLHALAAANRLKIHVRGCILWGSDAPDFEVLYRDRHNFEGPKLRLDCVKVFMDSVPNESRSAAMLDPYTPAKNDNSPPTRGKLNVDPAMLNAKITEWDRAGVIVKFHAGGDLAQQDALNAIEAARRANGMKGPMHEVSHNSFATAANLKRAKPLNAALEFSPVFWYPSPLAQSIEAAVGPVRAARAWPVREAIDDGALVFGASDWPAVESASPWVAIETLVTRRAPGGTGTPFAPEEAISLKEAVSMYTIWPAKTFGRAGADGTIHKGAAADLAIIDRDPFAIPITEIHQIKTVRTISDGAIIFDNGEIGGGTR